MYIYTQSTAVWGRYLKSVWIPNYIAQLGGWENIKALVSEIYCESLFSFVESSIKITSETPKTSYFTALEDRKLLLILNLKNFLRTLPTTCFLIRIEKDDIKNLELRYMCNSFLYLMGLWFPGWFTFCSIIILGHLKVELIHLIPGCE